jgi:hypothetical protein
MLASVIVNACRVTLIDVAAVTWSDAELLGYVNKARRTTALLKPDSFTVNGFVPMVAGTRQQLPAGGIAILDCGENQVSGRVATLVDRDLLNHVNRFWPTTTPEVDVKHWCADPRDPTRFDVAPPNDGTGSLEVLYATTPQDVELDQDIGFSGAYQHAFECFVLSCAYAKNTKRQDLAKSSAYMQEYRALLGVKNAAQAAMAPRVGGNQGG